MSETPWGGAKANPTAALGPDSEPALQAGILQLGTQSLEVGGEALG